MSSEHPIDDPLTAEPPAEVPLPRAPLVRVLSQVLFPPILKIRDENHIAPFQEAIRRTYPHFAPGSTAQYLVAVPDAVRLAGEQRVWRFSDVDGVWRVALAEDFLMLETTRYTSRSDFFRRFESLLRAAEIHLDPGICTRVGVRYIDRLVGEAYAALPSMVRPDLLGLAAVPSLIERAEYCLSDAMFHLPGEVDRRLRLRWGHVPPEGTVDPSTVEAIDEVSWLLDFDAFHADPKARFDPAQIASHGAALASRIYTVFRWAVTDRFLEHFGGEETP